MNRRDRRIPKSKPVAPLQLTKAQMMDVQNKTFQAGVKAGTKAGIRIAVETCMAAYTIVLEANGLYPTTVQEIFRQANDEVFKQLAENQLDLDDIPMFAKRCGVDVTA